MEIQDLNKKKLEKHLNLVLDANKKVNLTSITDYKEAQILHIEDSLCAVDIINNLKNGELVDIGSGAGYPGIPLAIMSNRKTTLVETVRKKADWLKFFVTELNLNSQIFVYNGRSEELAKSKKYKFSIATARALSSLSSILELASPLLCLNGFLVCYKSKNIDEEREQANKVIDLLGFEFYDALKYKLSNNQERSLVVYKKIKDEKINLPRKSGFAQKKPLHIYQ